MCFHCLSVPKTVRTRVSAGGAAQGGGFYLVIQCGDRTQTTAKKPVGTRLAIAGLTDVQAAVWEHTCIPFKDVSRSTSIGFKLYWRHWASETDTLLAEFKTRVGALAKQKVVKDQPVMEPLELEGGLPRQGVQKRTARAPTAAAISSWHGMRSFPRGKGSSKNVDAEGEKRPTMLQ